MRTTDVVVRNPSGLHARPAAMFVRTAAGFASRIRLQNVDRGTASVDAKSMIAIMQTGVSKGHTIRLEAEGADEDAAIEALEAFVRGGAGEAIPED